MGWIQPGLGLARETVKTLLLEAARNQSRVSGIWPNLLELFREVDRAFPLIGQRWVLGHQRLLDRDQINLIQDLGLVLTTHTVRHIYKEGAATRSRVGKNLENNIVPLRTLLDRGIPVAFGTDGAPPTMFMPIWQAVERIDRESGDVIAPDQRMEPRGLGMRHFGWRLSYLPGN